MTMTAIHYTIMLINTIIARSYLAADLVINNDDVLSDTALSVEVAASKKYAIEFVGHGESVTKALMFDFGGTATITNFIGQWYGFRQNDTTIYEAFPVASTGTDFGGSALDGIGAFYTFRGSVEINAAGTFLLRAAQNVADASNTTLKRGSVLIVTKMP